MKRITIVRWAALVFCVAPSKAVPTVVINEIMYHPVSGLETDEFLELYNVGEAPVDMIGWCVNGIEFCFDAEASIAAGQYFVLSPDAVQFQFTYGFAPDAVYPGALSNGGELLELLDAQGATVDRVIYDDNLPWPPEADGAGPSLELVQPDLPNELAESWRASVGSNGTPGAENSVFTDAPFVFLTVPARGTVVESLASISVTFSEPVTGVIAGGLTVDGSPATELSGSGSGPYAFSGFVEPTSGTAEVVLAAGAIAGSGGAGFAGDSWQYLFDAPDVVINEIHYHPAASAVVPGEDPERLQFLEFSNAEGVAVDLGGWFMSDGVDFVFPAGVVLEAESLLVLAKDAGFLQKTVPGIPADVAILQWNDGNLSNGGERVALSSPYYLVDEVTYGDGGVWPDEADGGGPSLELINPAAPNELPASWRASISTNGTPGAQNEVFVEDPAPIIAGTRHSPVIPAPFVQVTITTRVVDDNPAPVVTLYYREDQEPTVAYAVATMFDDGAHGDGAAGDNVYGAQVAGLAEDRRLDFAIIADDGINRSVAPAGHDTFAEGGHPSQTYLLKFSAAGVAGDFPTYHLITTQRTRDLQAAHNKNEYDATFFHCDTNGVCEIFYNVVERYRGASSLSQHPHSFRIEFASDNPLDSEMGFPITRLNLMAQQTARQTLGYGLFEALGHRAPQTQFVRLNTSPLSHGGIQEHVYINVERIDEDFFQRFGRFPPGMDTGNAYRARNGPDAALRWLGFDPDPYRVDAGEVNGYEKVTNETEDDWTDLIHLCDALWCSSSDGGLSCTEDSYEGQYEPLLESAAQVDQWARWFALHMVLNNREGGIYRDTGDDYFLYFYPTQDQAVFLGWDFDAIMVNPQETIWRTSVESVQRFLRHNAFAGRFVREICDLLDGEFSQASMDARIDALPDAVFPTPQYGSGSPTTKQQMKSWVAVRRDFIAGEIVGQLTLDGVPLSPYTHINPTIFLSGQVNQCGTYRVAIDGQPVDTFSVFDAIWSTQYILEVGLNPIVVQCLDRSGEEIERVEATVVYDPRPECSEDEDCDDGLFCTGPETCQGAWECRAGIAPCTREEWCDEAGQRCVLLGDGDFDADGDVDLEDFQPFQVCFDGPAAGLCEPANIAGGSTIDLVDYALFAQLLGGPH